MELEEKQKETINDIEKKIKLGKNQSSKYSLKFLQKTIKVWQKFSDIPLSSNDAIEITENITDLFNILITEDKKYNNKSIIKNNSYFKNKISKEYKKNR